MKKILVYGFYGDCANVGDQLFTEAYQYLFPNFKFVFTDTITISKLKDIDAVFFGGGSFLLEKPLIDADALDTLKSIKIFYLGIGVEDEIHPIHKELLSHARLIATRSSNKANELKIINDNVIYIPDLVYSLQSKVKPSDKIHKSVLILPNISVVPVNSDPYWMHAAWLYFKNEFAQFVDWLVENKYKPTFFSMCHGNKLDDTWMSCELVSHMDHRSNSYLTVHDNGKYFVSQLSQITNLISQYETVITQRFHGIVLAEMINIPYIAIHHHDKLKFDKSEDNGLFLSYYNCSKQSFINLFEKTKKIKFENNCDKNENMFKELVERVIFLLGN